LLAAFLGAALLAPTAVLADTTLTTGATATVVNTGGAGVPLNSAPNWDASSVGTAPEGASAYVVEGPLTDAEGSVWFKVGVETSSGWAEGYVWHDYLAAGEGTSAPAASTSEPTTTTDDTSGGAYGSEPTAAPSTGGEQAASGQGVIANTDGSGINCRAWAGLDADIITVLYEGETVALTGGQEGDWQPVNCGGSAGYVYAMYVSTGGADSGDTGTTEVPTPTTDDAATSGTGGLGSGVNATVTSDLNLRSAPDWNAGITAVAPAGTVVAIVGGPENEFYPVVWGDLSGYMYGAYLSTTDAPVTGNDGGTDSTDDTAGDTGGDTGSDATGSGGSGSGSSSVADYALGYVGYPYVYAGEGPDAFDCSGFTMYVIRNVLGIDITHDMFIQYDMGAPVAYGAWQPGDLVFFQNTFRPGLSHVGIYIGGNQFVHAANESVGVIVSDITEDYYSSRYYGAVRF
jgi:cell wall-associated NlpC family hydrolase